MDYIEKLDRMDRHLKEHPNDYQTVISRMKTYSEAVETERRHYRDHRLARLAEIRRQRRNNVKEC